MEGDIEFELALLDGFAPEDGDFFDVLTADQLMLGENFQLLLDAPVIDGKTFGFSFLNLPDPVAGTNRDVFRLTWGVAAIPEPSTGWILLLLMMFQFQKRHKVKA